MESHEDSTNRGFNPFSFYLSISSHTKQTIVVFHLLLSNPSLWYSLSGKSPARWPPQRTGHRLLHATSPAGATVLAQ